MHLAACYNQDVADKMPDDTLQGDTGLEENTNLRHANMRASIDLPEGAEVNITVQYRRGENAPIQKQEIHIITTDEPVLQEFTLDLDSLPSETSILNRLQVWFFIKPWRSYQIPWLFIGAMLAYYLVRLIRLADYPIFFFTDEAVHTTLAADLVRDGFKGLGGEFLPTFFKSGATYNAGFPVYLQVLPVLFGVRSVFITRFISVTVTLLAAAGVGLIFSELYDKKSAWLAVLVLSLIPTWFYHTRTAFETVEAVSFFAFFLAGYVKYLRGKPRWLFLSIFSAALAFYSYSPARVVIAVTAIFMLLSDLKYHWQMKRYLWQPALLGLVLILPYIRFLVIHPGENERHLQLLNSYWVAPQPVTWKILQFLKSYFQGLNPVYWFFPNSLEMPRHNMKGMGYLGWYFLPFFIAGLVLLVKKWKQSVSRVILLALFAAPVGAAVAEIGITRAMFIVIPASLIITIGLNEVIRRIHSSNMYSAHWESVLFTLMVLVNFLFLDVVLTRGPFWYKDYGFGGMQYGGQQVFQRIKQIRLQEPGVPIVLSPDWANGTDILARFHLGDPVSIELSSMDAYINSEENIQKDTIFIIPIEDFQKVLNSGKFKPIEVFDSVSYPDGSPGFIFTRLEYNEFARNVFLAENKNRKSLESGEVGIYGKLVRAACSQLDMGNLQTLFDNDLNSIVRSAEANPLVVELLFSEPTSFESTFLQIGGSATQVFVFAQLSDDTVPYGTSIAVSESTTTRKVNLPLPADTPITRLRYEVRTIRDGEPSHVHLWEIGLK